jgi:Na+-transporting NADH:ubiquinone oxidoreductase subunit C
VSEQQPKAGNGNASTIIFMVILSVVCALVLSMIASALSKPQQMAKELDRSEQMMIAAKILSYGGYFLIEDDKGEYVPAKYTQGGYLEPGTKDDFATGTQILEVYNKRLIPLLVDDKGDVTTFEKANVDEHEYLSQFQKDGYAELPLKLIYKILPNAKDDAAKDDPIKAPADGWVIPVSGMGLWNYIYGYLAIKPDGDTVIGITWYSQMETPGLGANIAEPYWQEQFAGKDIFMQSPDGKTDYKTASLGINVVKGKVPEVLGDVPKAKSAVDGMPGATLTGNGVTDAYRDTLNPYRPFLIKIHDQNVEKDGGKDNQKAKT